MIRNHSVPADTVLPHVVYTGVDEAIDWLTKTFGFIEHYRYGDPNAPSGAQMHLGNAWIMLRQARPGQSTPAELGGGTQSLTVFIDDVDAHFERAKSAGARIVEELNETAYGERQYGAVDFAGHRWLFSRHARDVNPSEWGAKVSKLVTMTPQISPGQGTTVVPLLSVRRGAQAIEFYKAAFGARELLRIEDEGGAVVARLSVGESEFWLADESPENSNFSPETLAGSSVRMVVTTDSPDAAFQRAVEAGARVVYPVEDQPYGWRVGRLLDPYGHHWEIGKPL
ncbi:MAG TPA: VOC family protein [Terriglobia bacterium]|nr:VOC family protein [Terriglobia bacterium]